MQYYIKIALQHSAMGLMIPISIIWKLQNGLSLTEAVMTESLILLVTAFADLPAGFIANKINNKRSLVLGALMHLIGVILLFVGGSLEMFIISALFTGVAWAFVSGADEAYLHDDFIKDKSRYKHYFSSVTIIDEVFTICGMLLTSLAISLGAGLKIVFLLASIILGIHLLYTWLVLPRSKSKDHTTEKPHIGASLKLFKSRELLSILPLMIAFAVVYEAARPLWQPHLQDIGVDIANLGVLFALFKLASIGGSLLSRHRGFNLSDLIVIFAVMLVSLLAFGFSLKVISIVALCAYLFTENYFRVYMSTTLNRIIKQDRAAILSIGSVIRNASGALIIAGAGILSSDSILLALAVLAVIKIPAFLLILRKHNLQHQT